MPSGMCVLYRPLVAIGGDGAEEIFRARRPLTSRQPRAGLPAARPGRHRGGQGAAPHPAVTEHRSGWSLSGAADDITSGAPLPQHVDPHAGLRLTVARKEKAGGPAAAMVDAAGAALRTGEGLLREDADHERSRSRHRVAAPDARRGRRDYRA